MNGSIVLKNGTKSWEKAGGKCPYINGALKFKPEELVKRLDNKATNLQWDPLADTKLNPSKAPEKSGSDRRYTKGFADILTKHFLTTKDEKSVLVLFSHSDGIPAFLNAYCGGLQMRDPGYCSTIAVECRVTQAGNEIAGYKVIQS